MDSLGLKSALGVVDKILCSEERLQTSAQECSTQVAGRELTTTLSTCAPFHEPASSICWAVSARIPGADKGRADGIPRAGPGARRQRAQPLPFPQPCDGVEAPRRNSLFRDGQIISRRNKKRSGHGILAPLVMSDSSAGRAHGATTMRRRQSVYSIPHPHCDILGVAVWESSVSISEMAVSVCSAGSR